MAVRKHSDDLKISPSLNFEGDVESVRTLESIIHRQKVIVPVRQYSNADFVEMKASSFRSLLDFADDKIEKNWDLYEKEKRQAQLLHAQLLNKQAEIEMLKTKLKAYEKFENQQGKGRPKVLSDEELEIAYKHLKSYKEKMGRYNYSRTFRYMQENYAYEGSHVTLMNSLREKHPELLDKPLQANTGQNKQSKPPLTDEMLEIAYKYIMRNVKEGNGKRRFLFAKANDYMQREYGYCGGIEQLKERFYEKRKKENQDLKVNKTGLAMQKMFQEKMKGDK